MDQVSAQQPKISHNMNEYMREYRQKNLEHMKNYGKAKYYRIKYGMPETFSSKYGEQAAEVFKLVKSFAKLIENRPELVEQILDELNVQ